MNKVQKEIQEELQKAYCAYAKARRNIKLPSALDIEMAEKGLRLRVSPTSVKANMQSDAAAVESWALLLRLWLGEKRVPHIMVDWDVPEARPDGHLDGHYERFLYRMYQFSKLFPGWFEVADPQKLQQGKAISETSLVLNVASKRLNETLPKTTSLEYQFEMELIKSPASVSTSSRLIASSPLGCSPGRSRRTRASSRAGRAQSILSGLEKMTVSGSSS